MANGSKRQRKEVKEGGRGSTVARTALGILAFRGALCRGSARPFLSKQTAARRVKGGSRASSWQKYLLEARLVPSNFLIMKSISFFSPAVFAYYHFSGAKSEKLGEPLKRAGVQRRAAREGTRALVTRLFWKVKRRCHESRYKQSTVAGRDAERHLFHGY